MPDCDGQEYNSHKFMHGDAQFIVTLVCVSDYRIYLLENTLLIQFIG